MKRLKIFARKNLFGIVTLCLSILMLTYGIFITGGYSQMVGVLKKADAFWIIAVFLSILVYWLLDGAILFMAARKDYKAYSFGKAFKTAMIGFFYNAVTPFATGGQPLQILNMTKTGVNAGDAVSYIIIKTIVYQVCLTISSVAAIFYGYNAFVSGIPNFMIFVAAGLTINLAFILVIVFLCLNKSIIDRLADKILQILGKLRLIKEISDIRERISEQIGLFHKSFFIFREEKLLLVKLFMMSSLQLIFFFIIPYFIYRSFHMHGARLFDIVAAQAIIGTITAFIPTPGATGAAEGSFYLFFRMLFAEGTVMAALVIWRTATYYSCIFFGGFISLTQIFMDCGE